MAPPPAKRSRKKNPDAPAAEKRGAITRKKCPKNIQERADRVFSQRMFMVNRSRNGDELREEFDVLGTTGNVYTVVIDKFPSCTCPDAMRGNHCKHILFIFLKVLQVPEESHCWFQKALLTSELQEIFANAPPSPENVVNARVREAYARMTGKGASSSQEDLQGGKKRIPEKDDDCPICYEGMFGVAETTLAFCESCGNALHKECFQQWARASKGSANCVYCRAPWTAVGPARPGGNHSTSQEGYLNLANVAGLSPVRDSSSYYHGPRRGRRIWEQLYDLEY
ncbi:hypothetical protein K474DRAFT_1601907 [Panus rudis PR-1116 ss-1]|nr:hypothetical protein K474DRAFT_1601907 [Panus rudis PR-1116 ss-1]